MKTFFKFSVGERSVRVHKLGRPCHRSHAKRNHYDSKTVIVHNLNACLASRQGDELRVHELLGVEAVDRRAYRTAGSVTQSRSNLVSGCIPKNGNISNIRWRPPALSLPQRPIWGPGDRYPNYKTPPLATLLLDPRPK